MSENPAGKRKTKRTSKKYPNLNPNVNLKTRWDEILDIDYVDALTDKEKQFLNDFMGEYVNASIPKDKKKRIHKTKKDVKSIYDKNNARNRCIYSRSKASGSLVHIEDMKRGLLTEAEALEAEALSKLFHPGKKFEE